jgi:hypothetical protein
MTKRTSGKKRVLTFGEVVAASYRTWGARKAKAFLRLAVNSHLLVFRGRQRLVIPEVSDENLLFKCNAE